jgi:hypothetical protein
VATLRTVLNNVLIVLGEDEIGSGVSELSDKYHKTLLVFFNQVKSIVEDAHNWRALRAVASTFVNANDASATLTNISQRGRVLRKHDEVSGTIKPLVVDSTDTSNPYPLIEIDLSDLLYKRITDNNNTGDPVYFAIDNSSADTMSLQIYPENTDNRTITVVMVDPQDDFDADDLDTTIEVPAKPIEVGTLWYALEERGEELGVSGLFNEQLFDNILASAIMRDAEEQGEYNLVPV